MNNAWAWKEREKRKERAVAMTNNIDAHYKGLVRHSIDNSRIYSPSDADRLSENEKRHDKNTLITVDNVTTVDAILKYGTGNTAVLNFASYKDPGGMFLQGSMAQEEALCHESILYNVLREFPEYYETNRKRLNKGLYLDRAIYSKDIAFRIIRDTSLYEKYANVITCAAPNKGTAQKYQNVSDGECNRCMMDRINFILNIALENGQESLILGAYGCGVFGNDAEDVAMMFRKALDTTFYNCFGYVIFAVPGNISDYNYQAFVNVFKH